MMSRAAQTHLAGRVFETPDLHFVPDCCVIQVTTGREIVWAG